jgi:glycosyltransferase involved in cell wall biosynthesis
MLSIIICTYNRDKYIYNALKGIAENDFPFNEYEIVLVNNNSTDNTEKECIRFRSYFTNVNFHYFIETKQGLSHARNRGMQEALGDFFVFLDDDVFVKSDYLKNLNRNLSDFPDTDAFGGKITPLFESGIVPAWISKWTSSWVVALDLGEKPILFKNNKYPIGANMGFSKLCADEAGLFNTQLGRMKKNMMGGEEKDFFNRLKSKSKIIRYFPNIGVEHVIPETRTTDEYIKRMGKGVGQSEKMRTLHISTWKYLARLISVVVKWGVSLVLFIGYIFIFQPAKGTKLLLFRWNVTKGLF